jgi:hypothetical protein
MAREEAMSEMVERVARAIWRVREKQFPERVQRTEPDGIDHATGAWELIEGFARAAIEEMRNPTPEMICAAFDCAGSIGAEWQAMIDEALR